MAGSGGWTRRPGVRGELLLTLLLTALSLCPGRARPEPPCHEETLERRMHHATVVISGTVREVMSDEENASGMFKSEVEIKRVFKGDKQVEHAANFEDPVSHKKMVMIKGFGDHHICQSHVRRFDTRIFLLNPGQNGEMQLNSSVLPITMYNLEHTDAIVRNIPFQPPDIPQKAPCDGFYCAFGARCQVNSSTNAPYCRCPERCPEVFAPVCGTDDVTYASQCRLERASCRKQRRIKVKAPGNCGIPDPCEGRQCNFGAKCKPSVDGLSFRCECPEQCYTFGDNEGSTPVCGNDGKDYPSTCELHRAACQGMKVIRVKYYGKCDPCEGFSCPPPQVCQLDKDRKPVCLCNFLCDTEFEPVCGTDAMTYSNACLLRKEACKSRRDINILYRGTCSSGDNPCEKIQCRPEEECHVDKAGLPSCVCPPPCQPILRRVCGNDSQTYDSECELRRQSCLRKVYVTVMHNGPCGHDVPCQNYRCEYDAVCVVQSGQPTCQCPICSDKYEPVCGSNGLTYENECKLRLENCERKLNVQVSQTGVCNGCDNLHCEFYSICESTSSGARCVCPSSCVDVEAKVCGSNGVTYQSECQLKVAACNLRQFITIASIGSCDTCAQVSCKFGARCENGRCVCPILCPTVHDPICASDGNTYANQCEMRRVSCNTMRELEVVHSSECDVMSGSGEGSGMDDVEKCDENTCRFGGTCMVDVNGNARCSCSHINCDAVRSPVCASDGRIYGNECQMRLDACETQRELTVRALEDCDADMVEEQPCDGSAPLVNPQTNQEYDCRVGKDVCPASSYCHMATHFAKCCKEEDPVLKCADTQHGCCLDRKTPAPGEKGAGCPEFCHCNPLGSYGNTCDPQSRQCSCKPGVGGLRCDRCEPGYWGLHKISEGNVGCIPCNCNRYGSARDDCEQMTGRCMCKPGIHGAKCNECADKTLLGPQGCAERVSARSCTELQCRFGAVCQETDGRPECVCELGCEEHEMGQDIVCGSDGTNYGSECQLRIFACRMQRHIEVAYWGPCKAAPPTRPTLPPTSTTRSRKTTRHISPERAASAAANLHTEGTVRPPLQETAQNPCETGGLIDQLCLSDADCCVNHSRCHLGLCRCLQGYVPAINNDKCIELVVQPPQTNRPDANACTTNPCHEGSTCQLDQSLGFRCLCPLGRQGPFCKQEKGFEVPAFAGHSYLAMKHVENASRDLVVEIIFETINKDGVLLFNAQNPDGSGDFISLAIKDGFVEFRFELGGGEVLLRSSVPVTPKKPHRVVARRLLESGVLLLDNEEPVAGSGSNSHTSLELSDPLFLGFLPNASDQVYRRVGVELGLVGCIHSLVAGSREGKRQYGLQLGSPDILYGAAIGTCGSNPCSSLPCQNGGTCLVLDDTNFECRCDSAHKGLLCQTLIDPCASQPCQHGGECEQSSRVEGFTCVCPPGRTGSRCEDETMMRVFVPQFSGDSYIELPLEDNVGRQLSIEIWFLASKPNGVLLFASQYLGGLGDFIALNMVKRKLQFSFSLGGGPVTIESREPLELEKWYRVIVQREDQFGQMAVDGQPIVTGEAPGTLKELNLGRPMFVGGFKDEKSLPKSANIETGFSGAIQRVIINGRTVDDLKGAAEEVRGVVEWGGPPCNVNPCMNGGVCLPKLASADCKCPAKFIGQRCEKMAELVDKDQPVKFDGNTFLQYPNEIYTKQEAQRNNNIKLRLRTRAREGLVLFQNKGDTVMGDYLALAIEGGRLQLSYNLGKQSEKVLHQISSTVQVDDGNWHTVVADRELRRGSLQVDDEEPVIQLSAQGATQLDTDGVLWIGGKQNLPWGLPASFYTGFKGCLDEVSINREQLHLVEHREGHSTSIAFCT